jgi:hypothetical protein
MHLLMEREPIRNRVAQAEKRCYRYCYAAHPPRKRRRPRRWRNQPSERGVIPLHNNHIFVGTAKPNDHRSARRS